MAMDLSGTLWFQNVTLNVDFMQIWHIWTELYVSYRVKFGVLLSSCMKAYIERICRQTDGRRACKVSNKIINDHVSRIKLIIRCKQYKRPLDTCSDWYIQGSGRPDKTNLQIILIKSTVPYVHTKLLSCVRICFKRWTWTLAATTLTYDFIFPLRYQTHHSSLNLKTRHRQKTLWDVMFTQDCSWVVLPDCVNEITERKGSNINVENPCCLTSTKEKTPFSCIGHFDCPVYSTVGLLYNSTSFHHRNVPMFDDTMDWMLEEITKWEKFDNLLSQHFHNL